MPVVGRGGLAGPPGAGFQKFVKLGLPRSGGNFGAWATRVGLEGHSWRVFPGTGEVESDRGGAGWPWRGAGWSAWGWAGSPFGCFRSPPSEGGQESTAASPPGSVPGTELLLHLVPRCRRRRRSRSVKESCLQRGSTKPRSQRAGCWHCPGKDLAQCPWLVRPRGGGGPGAAAHGCCGYGNPSARPAELLPEGGPATLGTAWEGFPGLSRVTVNRADRSQRSRGTRGSADPRCMALRSNMGSRARLSD